MRFQFDSWVTKQSEFHTKFNKGSFAPMRVMFGTILRTTEKCYYVEVCGKPEPSTHCLHCMRKLTHKVSMYYGLGPVCGKHYYIAGITEANLESQFDEIRKKMADITWRGLIPKNAVKVEFEDFHTIVFTFSGKQYQVLTSDMTKVARIKEKSDNILSDVIVRG
jgi:hypothetical protein